MLDSDTLPVDHAGNSEGKGTFKKIAGWFIGLVLLPVLGAVGGYFLFDRQQKMALIGLATGTSVSIAWVAWLAFRDARRLRLVRKIQEDIEDAWTAYAKGETARAEDVFKSCVKQAGQQLGRNDLVTLACMHTLGNLYRMRDSLDAAMSCYDQALLIYQKILPRTNPSRASLHLHRSLTYMALGNLDKAMVEAGESVALYREGGGQELVLAKACSQLARVADLKNEDELALQSYQEAFKLLRERNSLKSPEVLQAMGNLCHMYVKMRKFQESEQYLLELVSEYRQQPDLQPEQHVGALLNLVWSRLERESNQDCEALLTEALQILQTRVGPRDRLLQQVLDAYKRLANYSSPSAAATQGMVNLMLVFCGEREKLRQTLEKFPQWVNVRDATDWGPLHWAVFVGRDDIVRWLIQKGADVNQAGDKVSPLHVAAAWGKREALLELLDAGADHGARDARGWTPLFWCAANGKSKMVELLLKRGADACLRDDQGRTPLHMAAAGGYLATVAALIAGGAQLATKDSQQGRTPLHQAAVAGHLAVCECMVFNQGDLQARDAKGKNPIELAGDNHHRLLYRVLQRLTEAGLGRSQMRGSPRRVSLDMA